MKKLNEKDSYTVQCALETAAKRYAELEQEARDMHTKHNPNAPKLASGYSRMADQFKLQREDCDRLCNELAEREFVIFATEADAISVRR